MTYVQVIPLGVNTRGLTHTTRGSITFLNIFIFFFWATRRRVLYDYNNRYCRVRSPVTFPGVVPAGEPLDVKNAQTLTRLADTRKTAISSRGGRPRDGGPDSRA